MRTVQLDIQLIIKTSRNIESVRKPVVKSGKFAFGILALNPVNHPSKLVEAAIIFQRLINAGDIVVTDHIESGGDYSWLICSRVNLVLVRLLESLDILLG